jgi:hypothetical protein
VRTRAIVTILILSSIMGLIWFHATHEYTETGLVVTGYEKTTDSRGRPKHWVHVSGRKEPIEIEFDEIKTYPVGTQVEIYGTGCGSWSLRPATPPVPTYEPKVKTLGEDLS